MSALLFVKLKETGSADPLIPKEEESKLSLHMDSHLDSLDVLLAYACSLSDYLLFRMPGVTSTNYEILLERIDTLKDLYSMTRADLLSMLGEKNGTKLHQFLNASFSFSAGGKSPLW